MASLKESWTRWFGEEGPGRRLFGLNESQGQLARYLIILLAVGVVLMNLGSRHPGQGDAMGTAAQPAMPASAPAAPPHDAYARGLENRVRETLLGLPGVDRVIVSITLEAGAEQVLAEQRTRERRGDRSREDGDGGVVVEERSTSQPVLIRTEQGRDERPVVVMERMPRIQGVVVVVPGASSRLRLDIHRAVATLLGLPAHRVYVLAEGP
ncbi:MAG: hypothetical protein H0Z37_10765 [Firmicutes bacterium]|nr:hypothetical protein [Bacillota bacterium]